MSREADLHWFESNRARLCSQYAGQFLVIHDEEVRGSFQNEEASVVFSIQEFGLETASVFHAVPEEPIVYIGMGGRTWAG